jgi:hypothetical protein
MVVPRFPWVPEALARGNTLRRPACVHWTGDPAGWLRRQRERGAHIVGVELADEAVRLADLPAARRPTVVVLGHEQQGIPPEALDLLDVAVEIPMVGTGASLNVAVAGSLAPGVRERSRPHAAPAAYRPQPGRGSYALYATRSASSTAARAAARSRPSR